MKKFIFGLTVLLGVSLFLTGCPTDAETKTVYVPGDGMPYLHEKAATEAALAGYLDQEGDLAIGVSDDIALTTNLKVGTGKLVYILNGATLSLGTATKLEVDGGTITVGYGGKLEAEATKVVSVKSGSVSVVQGGELDVALPGHIDNGTADTTALGTPAVSISGGTLTIGTIATLDALKTAFGWVPSGELVVSALTNAAVKPSDIAKISGISASRRLYLTTPVTSAEEDTSLTIPAGLTLTAGSSLTLATITGQFQVNGTFTASGATLNGTTAATVTVGPQASLTLGTVALLNQSTVGTGGSFTVTEVTAFATNTKLAVSAGGTVNGIRFPGATNVTAVVETGNAVTIDSITIPASTTFTLPVATLTVTGALTFTNNTSRVVIPAGAAIGATVTGTFKATPTATNGAGVTLGVYATADLTTVTVFKGVVTSSTVLITTLSSTAAGSFTDHVVGNAGFAVVGGTAASSAAAVTSSDETAASGAIKADTGTALILAGAAA